ncbi:Lrp/AsnC family transcriptional regulator [Candidatus Woesearchaeota archaeon]|nr:Lrp/AsnC family transcriptional regulator [Candidatus Woesearchaeota archaeon]
MLKEKEMILLSHFRSNARISLTKLSKLTKIPVSTIFDKLKDYETRQLIKKSTAIIDFRKLGYEIRNQILISASKNNKEELQRFLIKNTKVNTIYRINNGYDFLVETIFKNMNEMDEFMKSLEAFEPLQKKEFFIMEDLKREEFLSGKQEYPIRTQL